jgi:hypothetical protein
VAGKQGRYAIRYACVLQFCIYKWSSYGIATKTMPTVANIMCHLRRQPEYLKTHRLFPIWTGSLIMRLAGTQLE